MNKDETSMNMNIDGVGGREVLNREYGEGVVRKSGREPGKDIVIDVNGREFCG